MSMLSDFINKAAALSRQVEQNAAAHAQVVSQISDTHSNLINLLTDAANLLATVSPATAGAVAAGEAVVDVVESSTAST